MFAEFADLYRALAIVGISPPVARSMELWQIAAVLGLARPDDNKRDHRPARPQVRTHKTVDGSTFTPAGPQSVDRIKERLAKAATDG